MNGFLVGDAGDVEEQEFFVERLGDFIIAKHLLLENRWSDAAADRHRYCGGEQGKPRAPHQATEDTFATPDGGLCSFEFRSLGHGGDARGGSARDPNLQTRRVHKIGRGGYE